MSTRDNVKYLIQQKRKKETMTKIIFFLGILLLPIIGYVMNIYKFAKCDFKAPYTTEVIRGIGIFPIPPLSWITGYMDIGEENK